jgi:hypothetical protein
MKKKKLLALLSVPLLLGLAWSAAWAQDGSPQDLPGGGWVTGTQIQNVGNENATIVMTVYDQTSGEWQESAVDVAPGSSANFLAAQFGWPDGSIGSAIVSSNQPIVAQTTETNGTAAAQYQGIGEPDTQVSFPLVKNDYKGSGKYTTFFVQNAGSSSAIIYATYTSEAGTKYPWNSGAAVEAGRMVVLNPTDVSFPSDQLGSLVVTSTVPIAGVVNEHGTTDTSILQATRGLAPDDAGTTLLIPTIKRQFGNRSTGPIIQNVSGGSADIYITYKGTGINFVQYAQNVPDGASVTFYENTEVCPSGATCGQTGTPLAVGTLASAVVTGTAEIVGVVNETFYTIPAGQRQRQTVTSAFNQAQATTEIGVPLYKVNHDYKNSGIQLQNTNLASTANFTATFSLGSGASVTQYTLVGSINPGEYVTLFKLYASLPAGASWVGSGFPAAWSTSSTSTERFGSVTVVADQPIVAAVTEADDDPVANSRQDIKSYEAFSLTP